jgi:hypothetical protein
MECSLVLEGMLLPSQLIVANRNHSGPSRSSCEEGFVGCEGCHACESEAQEFEQEHE